MKPLITLPCILFSFASICQITQTEQFKGSNSITVVANYSTDSLFIICGNALLDAGFLIKGKDIQFKTLRAIKENPSGYLYTCEINIRIKDSLILLTGNAINGPNTFALDNKYKGTIMKRGFDEMDKVAKSLSGTVYYEKK